MLKKGELTRRDVLIASLLSTVTIDLSYAASNETSMFRANGEKLLTDARRGNAGAQFKIADSIQSGTYGLKKDLAVAYAWLVLAKRGGNREADRLMSQVRSRMSARDLDRAEKMLSNTRALGDQTFSIGSGIDGPSGCKTSTCCFITTAVCDYAGLSDDCEELTILRWYRDNILYYRPRGPGMINEYYELAPAIVEKINVNPSKDNICDHLLTSYIRPSCAAILEGRFEDALRLYRSCVVDAERLVCPPTHLR